MVRKFLSSRKGIAALLVILLSLCLAIGLWLTVPAAAYAENEDDGQQSGQEGTESGEPAVNEWVVTPSIVDWKYRGFDKNVNIVKGEALYGEVVFRVFNSNGSIVLFDNYEGEEENVSSFTVDESGVVPDFVAEKFNTLQVGVYYLLGMVTGTDEYTSLGNTISSVQGQGYAFMVSSADNNWQTTPSIVPWTWGAFDRSKNVITAIPENSTSEMEITYGIYTLPNYSDEFAVKGLESFKTVNGMNVNGQVTTDIAAKLNALDSDTYYLRASVSFKDDKYTDFSGFVSFTVLQARNYWQVSPTVDQWVWDEFDFYNTSVISAVPALAADGVKVEFGVYKTEQCAVSASGDGRLLGFTEVGEEQQAALSELAAGEYWLKAVVPETNNYTKLETKISFTVRKNPNYWTSTPNVIRWTYGSFNVTENLITAEAKYGAGMEYGIFTNRTCTEAATGLAKFVNTASVAEYLEALHPDTYWLRATTVSNSSDYNNISAVVSFRVLQAQNGWQTSPYVLSWKYGEYDRQTNLINAVSVFGTATFSIYTDEACSDTDAVNFSETYNGRYHLFILENGLVPEYVAQKLATLNSGTYYLVARTLGNNDYTSLNVEENVPVPFEITPLNNYWVVAPSMKSWSEGHFDNEENKLVGSAKVGDVKFTIKSGDTVLFTVLTTDGLITSVVKANGERVYLDELNTLSVGSYKIIAEVEGTDNYSPLSIEADFAVFEDSVGLGGIIAAAITFAVFDVIAAGACITLIVIRRRKVEEQFRNMIRKELNRR